MGYIFIIFQMKNKQNRHKKNLIISRSTSQAFRIKLPTQNNRITNIFQNLSAQMTELSHIEKRKSYDVVGQKQIKNMRERSIRISKERRTNVTSMFAECPSNLSNTTLIYLKQRNLFTKKQALQKLSSSRVDSKLKEGHKNSSIIPQKSLKTEESSFYQSFLSRQDDSFHKVRQNFREQQIKWKQLEDKYTRIKGTPSIIQSISQERIKRLQREESSINYMKENISTNLWPCILHQKTKLKQIFNNNLVKKQLSFTKKKLSIQGFNKKQKEQFWITSKDQQGYFFKVHEQ